MTIQKQTPMFEAKFILPEFTPTGDTVEELHDELISTLLKNFVSVNVTPAEHMFVDPEEGLVHDDVLVYEVLLGKTLLDVKKLKDIVQEYAGRMLQTSVYFRQPDGEVYYLSATPINEFEE